MQVLLKIRREMHAFTLVFTKYISSFFFFFIYALTRQHTPAYFIQSNKVCKMLFAECLTALSLLHSEILKCCSCCTGTTCKIFILIPKWLRKMRRETNAPKGRHIRSLLNHFEINECITVSFVFFNPYDFKIIECFNGMQ